MADPYYISMVNGRNPDKEKHMIQVDIDAFSGAPVCAHTRAQFNMFIIKLEKIKMMKNFPEALLLLFWIDKALVLPDYLIKELKTAQIMITLAKVFQYLMMFGGLGMCGYGGYIHYKSSQKRITLGATKTAQSNQDVKHSGVAKEISVSTLQSTAVPTRVA